MGRLNRYEYSRLVDCSEIAENDYNLSIPLYVRKKGIEPVSFDLQECLDEWQENSVIMHENLEGILQWIDDREVVANE